MKLRPPVSHLLVDLDGTLLGNRSVPLSLQFVSQAVSILKKHGGWRHALRTLWEINREFGRHSTEHTNDHRVIAAFARRMNLSFEEGRRFLKESVGAIFPALEKHFFPITGAKEFLDWAKDRYQLILATNPVWSQEIVELRVRWAGIDPAIFGFVTDVRKMHACKPTRQYYEEILAQQSLKPEQCLLIGNDFKMDLPATRVGIRVFIVGDKFDKMTAITHPGGKAKAWKGSYADLRALLETE